MINEILYKWYTKCYTAKVYSDGAMLQEESTIIEGRLSNNDLAVFTVSNGWLESFENMHGIRECRTIGERANVPLVTVRAWLERLPGLIDGICFCSR